jgi:RNAse (barnase) inhibitor barstar
MIDVLNVNINIPIKVVFKKRVNTKMLKDKVLEWVANISYAKIWD